MRSYPLHRCRCCRLSLPSACLVQGSSSVWSCSNVKTSRCEDGAKRCQGRHPSGLMTTALYVGKDIKKFAKRITHIKAPNSPRLIDRSILYRVPGTFHTIKSIVDIINLDGQIG